MLMCVLLAFLQIERGNGDRTLVLTFIVFDLLLAAALAGAFLSLTGRWYTSLFAAVAVILLVASASILRMQYTGMKAQASDLVTLYSGWDLVKPFAGPTLAAAGACTVIFGLLMAFERPASRSRAARLLVASLAGLLFGGCALFMAALPPDDHGVTTGRPGAHAAVFFRSLYQWPTLHPATFSGMGEHCCATPASFDARFPHDVKPNIVVVLQESTFPPSHLRDRPAVSNFLFKGAAPLKIHVRGGGTWVEEYSLLHGVPPPVYGDDFVQINRLGPAMNLPGRIAPLLSGLGYKTTSIYPTVGEMLSAERMHLSLGMQHFVDCRDIKPCQSGHDWHKTDDSVFYDEVLRVLGSEDGPQFIFTGTMRQHSPHFHKSGPAYQREIMEEYGRRLQLSSNDAESFISSLAQLRRPTIVLMFGDHIPSDVMKAFDPQDFVEDPFHTFFNIYDASGTPRAAELMKKFPQVRAVDSAFLDVLLLDFAGFGGDYIDTKLQFMRECGGIFCGRAVGSDQLVRPGV
jgi:hypothetical protein